MLKNVSEDRVSNPLLANTRRSIKDSSCFTDRLTSTTASISAYSKLKRQNCKFHYIPSPFTVHLPLHYSSTISYIHNIYIYSQATYKSRVQRQIKTEINKAKSILMSIDREV